MPSDIYFGNNVTSPEHMFTICRYIDSNNYTTYLDVNSSKFSADPGFGRMNNISGESLALKLLISGRYNKKVTASLANSYTTSIQIAVVCNENSAASAECERLGYEHILTAGGKSYYSAWKTKTKNVVSYLDFSPSICIPSGAALYLNSFEAVTSTAKGLSWTGCIDAYMG